MKTNVTGHIQAAQAAKKAYQMPKLKVLGRVANLTLKQGSNVDGLGTFS